PQCDKSTPIRDAFVVFANPVPALQVEPSATDGSIVHTDGWTGYDPLKGMGYRHRITFLKGQKESASELLPRVHLVASLLKRWLLGTHQGAVSREHLNYYLDEFTFRFNRRNSKSRGKLFLPARATGGRGGTGPLQGN